jgi:hypothetical protein
MLFVGGPLLKLDADIEIGRRGQGYAGNKYVRTFAEVSDNPWHPGATSGAPEVAVRQPYLRPRPDEPRQDTS